VKVRMKIKIEVEADKVVKADQWVEDLHRKEVEDKMMR